MSRLAQKCERAPAIAAATGRTYLALKAYLDCTPPVRWCSYADQSTPRELSNEIAPTIITTI